LHVFRSNKNFFAQITDDTSGKTICAISTLQKDIKPLIKNGGNKKAAEILGAKFAEIVKSKALKKVVFDRRSYKFHGRVRVFADAVRKGGIQF